MSESAGKIRKSYVDHPKDRYKLPCLIHGTGHSPYECKVLGYFVSKYSKSRPTKYHIQEPATKNKFKRNQDNNSIVQHEVDDIVRTSGT